MPQPNNSYESEISRARKPRKNTLDSLSDAEDTADEWWDLEDTAELQTAKAARDVRLTQWPRPPEGTGLGLTLNPPTRMPTRKLDRRYSVQKPTRDKSKGRQKKQNAKAGIKVVTDFTPQRKKGAAPSSNSQQPPVPNGSRFVELADLQALKSQSQHKPGGFWRSKRVSPAGKSGNASHPIIPQFPYENNRTGTDFSSSESPRRASSPRVPSSFDPDQDLSPNDRPIVIGLSIPSGELGGRFLDPKTTSARLLRASAVEEERFRIPETPTILITPAQHEPHWSPVESQYTSTTLNIRPVSSLYSQAPGSIQMQSNNPFNPEIQNNQRTTNQLSYFSPDSEDASPWTDDEAVSSTDSKSRPFSSCTVFEEDESPIIVRNGRTLSVSAGSTTVRHASISTVATHRRSLGWWNYITTPFLTRSSTFTTNYKGDSPCPPLPDLAIAAVKASEAHRDVASWEKQFSPRTPKTSTSTASDPWWNVDLKHSATPTESPVLQETRHRVQTSTSTIPKVTSKTVGFGSSTISSIASTTNNPDSERSSGTNPHFLLSESIQPSAPKPPNCMPMIEDVVGSHSTGPPQINIVNVSMAHHLTSRPLSLCIDTSLSAPKTSITASAPPPPYSPTRVRYRAVFPPGHVLATQYPASPGPLSPEIQRVMTSRGAIQMSDVPLTPPVSKPINLNSGYPQLDIRDQVRISAMQFPPPPSQKIRKTEARRQRYEKEDAIAHKAGGLWRGRGCVSNRGCYGRRGAAGRKRRRWYIALIIGFLVIIALAVSLATTLHRKPNTSIQPSQWLNLTGFPPIYLGLSSVIAPINIQTNTGCVFPATQWSCDLPKELQASISPNLPNQPNFFFEIQWDNSSSTNETFRNVTRNSSLETRFHGGGPIYANQIIRSLLLKARQIISFIPLPTPPSYAEAFFLGNTTDGIASDQKAGEPTPFYISLLPKLPSANSKRQVLPRQDPFPNLTSIIPPPSLNSDGTAAPANLLPILNQQPIRLFDRGLPSEHYGFYTYFDRSIFLKSLTLLNETNTNTGEVPDDENGGATESEAAFRCTWTQTRFLVQIWTRINNTTRLLNSTSKANAASSVTDLAQPGSFPYPITITTDRHGGDPTLKMIYCYEMDDREGITSTSGQINAENRGFGGVVINAAPSLFSNSSDSTLGGYDGGTGGCSCQWSNFQNVNTSRRR